ncbi:TBC1 domain family member 7 [Coccinella septempunctata]|uniref:TBC1 domain family member 7 n=1 Tax=Coccinella septempunctata TaxID=41139 RepID=UPI001D078DA0|nr:TBC1 domain family member 7 [Coccinella septempunctata]XP_044754358.1 TBC1 domain family member 7 [Coccinella septempunctata]
MCAADERNFRSAYYEKVGCKNVEERKSLEILLKEKILDRVKLKQFCLRYSLPTVYRSFVWKICLGVLPVNTSCHAFISDQRKQEFNEMMRALTIMKQVDFNTQKSKQLYAGYLLQTDALKFDNNLNASRGFNEIVQFLLPFYKDDVELFWVAKGFFLNIHSFDHDFPKLIETIISFLEKEESGLFKHLKIIDALDNFPFDYYFDTFFANTLNYPALSKIWDKLCGGSCNIFVFVFISLLIHLKHFILKCKCLKEVLEILNKVNEDNAEVIFNKAIDMWQQGSHFTIHDKPKS